MAFNNFLELDHDFYYAQRERMNLPSYAEREDTTWCFRDVISYGDSHFCTIDDPMMIAGNVTNCHEQDSHHVHRGPFTVSSETTLEYAIESTTDLSHIYHELPLVATYSNRLPVLSSCDELQMMNSSHAVYGHRSSSYLPVPLNGGRIAAGCADYGLFTVPSNTGESYPSHLRGEFELEFETEVVVININDEELDKIELTADSPSPIDLSPSHRKEFTTDPPERCQNNNVLPIKKRKIDETS